MGEERAHGGIDGQPIEVGIVRFVAQQFLQHGHAHGFAIVKLQRGARTPEQFAIATVATNLSQRVVERAVHSGDRLFEVKGGDSIHRSSS